MPARGRAVSQDARWLRMPPPVPSGTGQEFEPLPPWSEPEAGFRSQGDVLAPQLPAAAFGRRDSLGLSAVAGGLSLIERIGHELKRIAKVLGESPSAPAAASAYQPTGPAVQLQQSLDALTGWRAGFEPVAAPPAEPVQANTYGAPIAALRQPVRSAQRREATAPGQAGQIRAGQIRRSSSHGAGRHSRAPWRPKLVAQTHGAGSMSGSSTCSSPPASLASLQVQNGAAISKPRRHAGGRPLRELLREMPMTSPCTVSLLWSRDADLDQLALSFRIWLNGRELNCSSRKVDIGTNTFQVQRNPAENISLNQVGTYDVKVESLSRNIVDVPFKVVVRRSGQEAEVYEGVWPRRAAKSLMDVCQVTVEPEDLFEQSPEAPEDLPPRVSSPPPSAASGVATTPKFAFEDDGLASTLQAPANQRTFAFDPQRLPSSHRRLPAKVSGLAQPGEIQVPAKYRSEAPAPCKVYADAFPEDVEVSLPCTSSAQASSPSPLRAASAPAPPWPQEDEFPPPARQAAVAGRGAGRMTPEPGICLVQGSNVTQGERPRSPPAGAQLEASADSREGERRSKRRHRREGSRRSSRSSLPEFEGEDNDRRQAPVKSEILPIADQADGSSLAASPPLSRRPSTEAETVDGRASDRSHRRSRRRQESDELSQGVSERSERSERRRRRRQEDEETNATSESRRSHRSRRRRGEDEDAASEATSGGSRRRRDDEDRGSRSSRRRRRREAEAEELAEPGDSHRLARIQEESSGGSPPGPPQGEEITNAAISAAPQRLEMQTLAVPPLVEATSMRQTSFLIHDSGDAKPKAAVDPTRMEAPKSGAMNMSLLKSYASSRSSTALPSSPGKSSSAATVSSRLTGARLNEVRRAEDAAMFEAERRWEEEVDSIRRQAMRYSQGVRLRGPSFSMDRGDLILRPS
eukprot:s762_g7.t1